MLKRGQRGEVTTIKECAGSMSVVALLRQLSNTELSFSISRDQWGLKWHVLCDGLLQS